MRARVTPGTGDETPDQIRDLVDEHRAASADLVCVQALRADTELPLAGWRTLADALVS